MELNEIQIDFLLRACELNWAVLQFDVTNKEFKRSYGYTKKQANEAILDLKKKL